MQADSQGHEAPHPDIQTLHQQLVDKVKLAGYITSSHVEEAFRAVPRHLFLPHLPPQEVYQDRPIMTKMLDGQYVSSSSQPTIMAIMLEQLDLQPGQRVLEIGAGTGYNAALMAHIVGETGKVVTIDIDDDIVEGARMHLAAAGYGHVQVICADGGLGYPDTAPYDRIILTVSSADITPAWREQLRPDGRFLLPLVVRGPQLSVTFVPQQDSNYWQSVSLRACGFVGLRGAFAGNGESLQLAPEPQHLILGLGTPRHIDAEHILSLLQGSYRDMTTQVMLTSMEMHWALNSWLAIHEPLICNLTALGNAATSGLLPGLIPPTVPTSEMHIMRATGLLSHEALALLYSSQEPHEVSSEEARQSEQASRPSMPSFMLNVRSYGKDDTLAQHLLEQIQTWSAAGRPNEQRLHIRTAKRDDRTEVRDADDNANKGEHDILIERKWSSCLFNWQ